MGQIVCPGCGVLVEDPHPGEFTVERQSDGRYIVGLPYAMTWVLHACERPGPPHDGGAAIRARPSGRPPSGALEARRVGDD